MEVQEITTTQKNLNVKVDIENIGNVFVVNFWPPKPIITRSFYSVILVKLCNAITEQKGALKDNAFCFHTIMHQLT